MKYPFLLSFVLGCSLVFGALLSVTEARAVDSDIYVVDIQRVVATSVAGKAARSNIEDERARRGKRLEQVGKELERERKELMKQAALLSKSALEDRKLKFMEKEKDFQRSVNDQKEELGRLQRKELTRVLKEIEKVVDELAKEEGVSFVIERDPRLVLYVSKGFDYTEKVIQKLNKRKLDL